MSEQIPAFPGETFHEKVSPGVFFFGHGLCREPPDSSPCFFSVTEFPAVHGLCTIFFFINSAEFYESFS
jgi:hypothetical protein